MTSPGGSNGEGRQRDVSAAAFKGVVLLVVVIVVGIFLLNQGTQTTSSTAAATTTTTTVDVPLTTTTAASKTTTTAKPEAAADVVVLVANASGLPGAAGRVSTQLGDDGFTVSPETNANATAQATTIFYTDGNEDGAKEVAEALGVDSSAIAPMPTPPPVASVGEATVLVVLGPDKAPTS